MSYDVVDALDGFATLTRRTQTLGGSVPLRVAQACVPLLEGNAWGHQITLAKRLELRRRFGRWSLASAEDGDAKSALLRGGLPMLGATLAPAWRPRLEEGLVVAGRTISVVTGLFVKPHAGHRLRIASTANRRSLAYEVTEAIYDDPTGYVPVILEVTARGDADRIIFEGEVATLGVLPAGITVTRATLAEAPELVAAHIGFYDAAYFATKKEGTIARKYRDELTKAERVAGREGQGRGEGEPVRGRSIDTHHTTSDATSIDVTIVDGGPRLVEPAAPARVLRTSGVARSEVPDRLVVKNAVAFEATFDGAIVTIEPDRAQLERYAADIRERWKDLVTHQGALLYLAKYFTPHPPGEPHFFTKPAALIRTSPGTSTLISGVNGPGYDVLRGVVRTDTFHATPSVFHLWQPGRTISVAQHEVLAELFPITRTKRDDDELAIARGGAALV